MDNINPIGKAFSSGSYPFERCKKINKVTLSISKLVLDSILSFELSFSPKSQSPTLAEKSFAENREYLESC